MVHEKNTILQAMDLVKNYNQGESVIRAVDHISLEIFQSELVAVTGQSGSGKTTLLNILGCITKPDAGELWIGDMEVVHASDSQRALIRRKQIGYVFQDFKLLPALTARENILLPLQLDSIHVDAGELNNLCQMLDIDKRLDHFPDQLSGGQQQRVSIARALLKKPEIILADEPTGNLDSQCAMDIMNIFLHLSRRGCTILMVTHNEQIAKMCSREIHIRDGKLLS